MGVGAGLYMYVHVRYLISWWVLVSLARGVFAGMRSACGGPGGLPLGSATHF